VDPPANVTGMDLAAVFANVPRVRKVEGCLRCFSRPDLKLLGMKPAQVPDKLAISFVYTGIDHWSEKQYSFLWRGLAPRILSVLEASPDPIMLRGLIGARFTTWPAKEQAAVRDALREMLARAVTGGRPPRVVADLVCAAAHADCDPTPWLRYLDTLGEQADGGVATLARHWAEYGSDPTLWWFPDDPGAPIRDWLHSGALEERLSRMDDLDTLIAIAQM
jgi:hypothetical protein